MERPDQLSSSVRHWPRTGGGSMANHEGRQLSSRAKFQRGLAVGLLQVTKLLFEFLAKIERVCPQRIIHARWASSTRPSISDGERS